jgi:hypothetical protein
MTQKKASNMTPNTRLACVISMRLRVIIIGVVAFAAVAGISSHLVLTAQKTSGSHSLGLAASIVGYTNRTDGARQAMLEVRNRGPQSIWLDNHVTVHYWDTVRSSDSHILPSAGELKPGAKQLFCIPAPAHQIRWRAEIGGVNQLEIAVKEKLRGTVFPKDHPFELHLQYSQTEWIAP